MAKRKVVEIDVQRVDGLLEKAMTRPLEEAEAAELKSDFNAMMEALWTRDFRTSEKTRDVLPQPGGETASDGATKEAATPEKKKKTGGGGYGRHGVDSLPGAVKVPVPQGQFAHKCMCPECSEGKLYPMKEPSPLVRFKGHAPIEATVYELERLRCNRCL